MFQLKKEVEDLTSRLGQQVTVQEIKEGSSSESCKEEELSQAANPIIDKVKEEPGLMIKKEPQEEEVEVLFSIKI